MGVAFTDLLFYFGVRKAVTAATISNKRFTNLDVNLSTMPVCARLPLLVIAVVIAQTPAAFEAASVKALKDPFGPNHFTVLPNRLDVKNLSLGYLIQQAYDLPAFQISGPGEVLRHTYDVMATSGAPVSKAEMRVMLQNLPCERFHLATHWEEKTESVFRLVVLPGGLKMKKVDFGFPMANSPLLDGNSVQLNGPMSMRQLVERM